MEASTVPQSLWGPRFTRYRCSWLLSSVEMKLSYTYELFAHQLKNTFTKKCTHKIYKKLNLLIQLIFHGFLRAETHLVVIAFPTYRNKYWLSFGIYPNCVLSSITKKRCFWRNLVQISPDLCFKWWPKSFTLYHWNGYTFADKAKGFFGFQGF